MSHSASGQQATAPRALTSTEVASRLSQCIHCGLCLPACPTYAIERTEMDSPRGRIALMRAASAGRVEIGGAFEKHIDRCLGCRACEPACPSGVEYGALLTSAREAIRTDRDHSRGERFVRWLGLRQLLPHRARLRGLATLTRGLDKVGLLGFAGRSSWLPDPLRQTARLFPSAGGSAPKQQVLPAEGEKRGRVAFFRGCVQDAFLGRVNTATVRVLQRNGFEVHLPGGQTCCGAAAHHLGESELAKSLARRNLDAFAPTRFDAIINNAGGCGAMLGELAELFDSDTADAARAFEAASQDISQFLANNLHRPPRGALDITVTYADSCHLRHAQGVVDAPRELLRVIPGVELRELARPDTCCGSAGVYNLTQPEIAEKLLADKLADIRQTQADVVVVTNTGCHLQLLHGVRQLGLDIEVVHLVELLERSYDREATG